MATVDCSAEAPGITEFPATVGKPRETIRLGWHMPGGRPETGGQHTYPELAEMAAWFQNALASAGYPSINAFVQRHPIDKNRVYALFKGSHLYPRSEEHTSELQSR